MGLSQLQIGDGSGQGKASDVRIVDQDVETVRAKIVSNSNRLECDPIHPQMYLPHWDGCIVVFEPKRRFRQVESGQKTNEGT
jgi:hypothetical protein